MHGDITPSRSILDIAKGSDSSDRSSIILISSDDREGAVACSFRMDQSNESTSVDEVWRPFKSEESFSRLWLDHDQPSTRPPLRQKLQPLSLSSPSSTEPSVYTRSGTPTPDKPG